MPNGVTGGLWSGSDESSRQLLSGEVAWLYQKVEEIKDELPRPGEANVYGLDSYALFISEHITEKFIEYLGGIGSDYNRFLNSGNGPKLTTENIIEIGVETSSLFEQYVRAPDDYSRAACQSTLKKLLVELSNLNWYCENY